MTRRLEGLDLARFLAFVGMVLVNFAIVMGAPVDTSPVLRVLPGKAAATFVVLAGIGLGLSNARVTTTVRRGLFLLVIGLANTLIFEADILHYYGVYFLVAAALLGASIRTLIIAIAASNVTFVAMLFVFDYEAGWNWATYDYAGFWTPEGFVRNLFFNGWHPVFPWVGFVFFGMALARLPLHERGTQHRLIGFGLGVLLAVSLLSALAIGSVAGPDSDMRSLLDTSPLPPTPPYTLVGMASAAFVIGLCLRVAGTLQGAGAGARVLRVVGPAGRMTLTLYIAHIILGMGTLEELGMVGGQALGTVYVATTLFCIAAIAFAYVWSHRFARGPAEMAMRAVAG